MPKKLDSRVFKYIEFELYNYDETRIQLQELRNDILDSSSAYIVSTHNDSHVSDPTASKAIALVSSVAIARMERVLRAIDRALSRLHDEHRMLFDLKYRKKLSVQQICLQMPTTRQSYYRYRDAVVRMVACELGLINPTDL